MSPVVDSLHARPFDLPNGLRIQAVSPLETKCLYHEIFRENVYGQHGVTISDGDCVMDVGANIGLFAIRALSQRQRLQLFAFEPIPAVFDVLQQNVRAHQGDSQVTLANFGLADCEKEAIFDFNPFMTVWTSSRRDDVMGAVQPNTPALTLFAALVSDVGGAGAIPRWATRLLLASLKIAVLRQAELALAAVWWLAVRARRNRALQKHRCQLRTISSVMREHDIQHVDLLKVDVEGAELDVLRGVDDADWKKIRQVVLEVHDVDGRVEVVNGLLGGQGFDVEIDANRSAMARVGGIHMVYATRHPDG